MADDISGTALGLLAAYLCLGLGIFAVQLFLRAGLRRGRPPARDLSPHEIAYLHGEERRAVAVSLAALRLDHAVDAFADGRLLATRPGPDRPRAAAAPLDEAVLAAIAGDRAAELDDLAVDPGVEAALDRIGADLGAQGLLTEPKARRRLVTVQAVMLVWAMAGLEIFIREKVFSGFPDVAIPAVVIGLPGLAGLAFGAGNRRTREGRRVAERQRESHPRLDPGHAASRDQFTAADVLLGIALHGAPAVLTFDPDFARTAGLDRYLDPDRDDADEDDRAASPEQDPLPAASGADDRGPDGPGR